MLFGTRRVIDTLPTMVFISLFIVIAGYFLMNHTTMGRNLEFIGNNRQASILSGITIKRVECLTYIGCGLLAGFAGLFLTMRTGGAAPTLGGGTMAFEAVTACVIGGTKLTGGSAPIICNAVSVLILKLIENCINLLNLNTYIYDAVLSIIVFAAIVVESMKKQEIA
jgi:ribose transport system permease protein